MENKTDKNTKNNLSDQNSTPPPVNSSSDAQYNGMDGKLTDAELQQDEHFMHRLTDNITEMRNTVSAGAAVEAHLSNRPPITEDDIKQLPLLEDEAKALLIDETHKVEQNLQKANQKPHKTLMLVMIIAVAICIAGVAFALIMGAMRKDDQGDTDATGNNGQGVQAPADEDTEISELGLDNPMVQKLYHNFDAVGKSYTDTMNFYAEDNINVSDVDKEMMLAIALRASKVQGYCNGSSDYAAMDALYDSHQDCYNAEIVRLKVNEIFGQDVELVDGDWAGKASCSWQYSSQHDEFYVPATGCGGTCFLTLNRTLDSAQRKGNQIYIYETVYGENCEGIYHADGSVIAVNEYDDQGVLIGEIVQPANYKEQFDHYKWTFTRNTDGFYVFDSLEKID